MVLHGLLNSPGTHNHPHTCDSGFGHTSFYGIPSSVQEPIREAPPAPATALATTLNPIEKSPPPLKALAGSPEHVHQKLYSEESVASLMSRGLGNPLMRTDLVNNNNLQYYGEVHIGDPPQKFLAIYDTGSEQLWVPGERCHGEACVHHHKFHPVKSQTFQQSIGGERRMTYGTGEVRFREGKDTVRLCDSTRGCFDELTKAPRPPGSTKPVTALAADRQPVGMTSYQSPDPFKKLPFDGILGLPPSGNFGDGHHQSLLGEWLKVARFRHHHPRLISFYLSPDTSVKGSVAIGGIDRHHIDQSDKLRWHNIHPPTDAWRVQLVDIAVDGKPLHLCGSGVDGPEGTCEAMVDTGSSLITGPQGDASKVLERIGPLPHACDRLSSEELNRRLPQLDIILRDSSGKDVWYPLKPSDYVIRFEHHNGHTGPSQTCELGVGKLDLPFNRDSHHQGRGVWVLGDTFLRRYYSVFDDAHHRVGLIRSYHGPQLEPGGVITRAASGVSSILAVYSRGHRRSHGSPCCASCSSFL
ncbi:hypothetical protein FOZ63_032041 [Perkinsus olseni]|uniref:Peptidase A1 domain-containing protein n=1 Tax=Perkinsus olseni TaxID=32597 RepID=A0A7J6RUC5_PEROL|nr:hypothetical protein FOZ60_005065 [Perkinsus olseni]KAF4708501.1 hypothetical protein FOZ63_032041 [Perkinsus olseni]KAF4724011.1 hypothetical protein FOZ62_003529 [Perkinsus olseni]